MCTPGCRGNRRRPHKRVDEQKTQRPSSTEKKREKENQISFLGEGFGWCVCVENEEVDERGEEGGRDG